MSAAGNHGVDTVQQQFDRIIQDIDEEQRQGAEEIAGDLGAFSGMAGACDLKHIWLRVEEPRAGWNPLLERIADRCPRDETRLRDDIEHAIREAARAEMTAPRHVDRSGSFEYQVKYQLYLSNII
jgi:hypothetical protein